jgi:hypothetical protein
MGNKPVFDEGTLDDDTIARLARVLAPLFREGVLHWSTISSMPVTGRRDGVTNELEEYLRHG